MELENSNTEEAVYKRQYQKAAALLTAAQKKLNRIRLSEKQPTQPTICDKLTSCASCGAVEGCAWCGSSLGFGGVEKGAGMCRRMDVNARLRAHPKMDGLTSGECEAKHWQTKVGTRISTLSFNVFASDLKNARRRARTIFRLIKRTDPSFIAFQEVEDWFLQALKLEPWTTKYYQSDFGSGHAPGGLYILSKFPLSKVAYNEQTAPGQVQYDQRARVLTVNAVINQTPPPPPPKKVGAQATVTPSRGSFVVTFATTNLDWRSADSRTDGLDFVFATLSPFNDVILAGDVNFDHGAQPETSHIPENWLDVWPALNPENLGYTWDPESNRYARASDPASRPSRIDRVLIKSVHWLPRYIKLVGCSSKDLLCQGLFAAPKVPGRPHALPQPLSQPHASTEANSPPISALAKPSVFLEVADGAEAEADAEETEEGGSAVIPSNHYGLLTHFSRFEATC
jgi:endonuclease/exonuclease/phosphatase family metal-dependent hydrolase